MLKLNGGLGTGMGLDKAKSLLKVSGEDTFLDLIAKQVRLRLHKIVFHCQACMHESIILELPSFTLPIIVQYDCTTIAQYTTPHDHPLRMPYTIQYWRWQYRVKAMVRRHSIAQGWDPTPTPPPVLRPPPTIRMHPSPPPPPSPPLPVSRWARRPARGWELPPYQGTAPVTRTPQTVAYREVCRESNAGVVPSIAPLRAWTPSPPPDRVDPKQLRSTRCTYICIYACVCVCTYIL